MHVHSSAKSRRILLFSDIYCRIMSVLSPSVSKWQMVGEVISVFFPHRLVYHWWIHGFSLTRHRRARAVSVGCTAAAAAALLNALPGRLTSAYHGGNPQNDTKYKPKGTQGVV